MRPLIFILILMWLFGGAALSAGQPGGAEGSGDKAKTAWFWNGKEQKAKQGKREKKETPYVLKTHWPPAREGDHKPDLAENLLAKNFVLVFDGSGSMTEKKCAGGRRKIDVAKEAAAAWAKSVPEDANVGLVAFHADSFTSLNLTGKSRAEFAAVVNGISAGGGTPLGGAVYRARSMLEEQARRQLGYGEYTIVVITDGEANNIEELARAVRLVLDSSPIVIHTIGFCIDERHSLNQPGRTVYRTADNPDQLRQGLQEVLAESETFDLTGFDK